uniref:X-box-binding protein 1 n=1 Tax=Cuerna arida TaxID=1464854 RepID=A0A1B6GA94_9HEMI
MSFQLCFDENNSTFFINDIQQEENVPETNSSSGPSRSSTSNRGRKRTLDNLSWEERVQRKKMKNRVAAQVSRDRKKAKFESMEQSLLVLKTAYEYQTTEFNELKKNYSKLQKEYTDLRRDFENFKSLTEERTLTRVAAPAQPATQPDSSNGSAEGTSWNCDCETDCCRCEDSATAAHDGLGEKNVRNGGRQSDAHCVPDVELEECFKITEGDPFQGLDTHEIDFGFFEGLFDDDLPLRTADSTTAHYGHVPDSTHQVLPHAQTVAQTQNCAQITYSTDDLFSSSLNQLETNDECGSDSVTQSVDNAVDCRTDKSETDSLFDSECLSDDVLDNSLFFTSLNDQYLFDLPT